MLLHSSTFLRVKCTRMCKGMYIYIYIFILLRLGDLMVFRIGICTRKCQILARKSRIYNGSSCVYTCISLLQHTCMFIFVDYVRFSGVIRNLSQTKAIKSYNKHVHVFKNALDNILYYTRSYSARLLFCRYTHFMPLFTYRT